MNVPVRALMACGFATLLTLCSSVGAELSANTNFIQMRVGLCEDYPEESRSIVQAKGDLLLLKTNDIRYLRIAFGWDAMEPERGKYDWSFWDEFVLMAETYGIQLIPYVCYTPQWASSESGPDFWRAPPRDNRDFARFVEQLVSRYKRTIKTWELWNEPDNRAYWTGSVQQFAALMRAGSAAVREADPEAKVVLGGLAWDLQFLDKVLNDGKTADSVDIINLHNYFETWAPDPAEEIDDYVHSATRIIEQAGGMKPLWMAELGYSSFRSNSFVSDVYEARFDHEHRERFQAATVFRMLVPLLSSKRVSLAAWYRINDLPKGQDVIGDVNNRFLGVLDVERRPKPALHALRFFQLLFKEGVQPLRNEIRLEAPIASHAEVHGYRRIDGSLVAVTWLPVVLPEVDPAEGSNPDARREKLGLKVPSSFGSADIYDAEGKHLARVNVERGNVEFLVPAGEARIIIVR